MTLLNEKAQLNRQQLSNIKWVYFLLSALDEGDIALLKTYVCIILYFCLNFFYQRTCKSLIYNWMILFLHVVLLRGAVVKLLSYAAESCH